MRKLNLHLPGLIVPPLTPFDEEGRVDVGRLERQVEFIIRECRPAAISVAAVEAQEYQFLGANERRELVRQTAAAIAGRVPMVVGVSHPSVREAARLAQLAEEVGAIAVQLLIPLRPSGGAPTLNEVIDYFESVGRETALPIVAYHNPGPGADAPVAWLMELAKLDAVQAFKESSRNLRHVGRLVAEIDRAGHARYLTTMEMLLPTLALGGSGGTVPPPAAVVAARIIEKVKAGRWEEAAADQRLFSEWPSRWLHAGLTAVMKASFRWMGLDIGDPWPPFARLEGREAEQLGRFLSEHAPFLRRA